MLLLAPAVAVSISPTVADIELGSGGSPGESQSSSGTPPASATTGSPGDEAHGWEPFAVVFTTVAMGLMGSWAVMRGLWTVSDAAMVGTHMLEPVQPPASLT